MNKLTLINKMYSHPWLGPKVMLKLKGESLIEIHKFLDENLSLDKDEFEKKINRLYLHKEKPKQWSMILEVLSNINTMRYL